MTARLSATRTARKRLPIGTTFSFNLSAPATVTLHFAQHGGANRPAGRCFTRKQGRANTGCITAATLRFSGHAGVNHVRFEGRVTQRRSPHAGPLHATRERHRARPAHERDSNSLHDRSRLSPPPTQERRTRTAERVGAQRAPARCKTPSDRPRSEALAPIRDASPRICITSIVGAARLPICARTRSPTSRALALWSCAR
jgi:hypothetical protein